MEDSATTKEFERERYEVEPPLPTREEVAYYRIFAEALDHVRPKLAFLLTRGLRSLTETESRHVPERSS